MVKLLAIEASSEVCSVALMADGSVKQLKSSTPKSHSTEILPLVDKLLADAGISLRELDAIAFGEGPGSFTGLRICLSVAQGLAYGLDLPLVPTNCLQGMACSLSNIHELKVGDQIVCVVDARMQEVYWQSFEISASNTLRPIGETILGAYDAASKNIATIYKEGRRTFLVGSGVTLLEESIRELFPDTDTACFPDALGIVAVAKDLFQNGVKVSVNDAEPRYLRNSVAWNKRKRIRS